MKKISVRVVGGGSFGVRFSPVFQAHPCVSEVSPAEILPDRRHEVADKYGIRRTFESLDSALASAVDAVAIITQRHLHGSMSIAALQAGKHVYCAVQTASKLSEIEEICRLTDGPDFGGAPAGSARLDHDHALLCP